MIESKVRLLVQKLELTEGITLAHPYVKPFENSYVGTSAEHVQQIIDGYGTLGGEAATQTATALEKASNEGEEQEHEVHLTKLYIGLDIAEGHKKLDIQYPCLEFFSICKGWATFDDKVHVVQIKNVKLYDLPNDVYVEGETRPTKATKRKRAGSKADNIKRPKSVVSA